MYQVRLQEDLSSLETLVSNVQTDVSSIKSDINEIMSRRWIRVKSISGTDNSISDTFQITGTSVKVRWRLEGNSAESQIWIGIYQLDGTLVSGLASSGTFSLLSSDPLIGSGTEQNTQLDTT